MGSSSGVIPSETSQFLQHFLLELLGFEILVTRVLKMKNMHTKKYNLDVFNECVLKLFRSAGWVFFHILISQYSDIF